MSDLPLFDHLDGPNSADAARDRVWRVSDLNRVVRGALEETWGDLWVEGELADVTRAASGHVYFTLQDEERPAQVRGVLFRGDARRSKATLERGAVVRMRGKLSIYEPRGSFQLIARIALPAGEGNLHAQFLRTRQKLEAEGLFDVGRKRPLPAMPRVVGVVTSIAGAALHDIVQVSSERCPVRIVVADCRVQGAEAPATIVAALTSIQRLEDLDVVVVGRGGGSAEDLQAFNDEAVARAIAACRVPTVSAVGHEVDVTIADLVADVRAATPSNAAELVVPDRDVLGERFEDLRRRLEQALDNQVARQRLALERLQARVLRQDARAVLQRHRTHLAEYRGRLGRAVGPTLAAHRRRLYEATVSLRAAGQRCIAEPLSRLGQLCARLDALDPRAVLSRGYAIVLHEPTGRALLRASDANAEDRLDIVLHEGRLPAQVLPGRRK